MDNYPPGVTGNEPQISGIWPCGYCGGQHDTGCGLCKDTGVHPEEAFELKEFMQRLETWLKENTDLGHWNVEEADGYLRIYTDLVVYGDYVIQEDDN